MSSNERILARKVLSSNSLSWIKCCWMHCDKRGVTLHMSVFHEHARSLPCDHPLSEHVKFIFCSEKCKQYYLYSHKDMGNLPPGFKSSL